MQALAPLFFAVTVAFAGAAAAVTPMTAQAAAPVALHAAAAR